MLQKQQKTQLMGNMGMSLLYDRLSSQMLVGGVLVAVGIICVGIYAFRRHWRSMAGAAILSIIALIVLLQGSTRYYAEKSIEAARLQSLREITPDVDFSKIDSSWWTSRGPDGFGPTKLGETTYRRPLRWPWEMRTIAIIGANPPSDFSYSTFLMLCSDGKSAPRQAAELLGGIHGIEQYAFNGRLCAFAYKVLDDQLKFSTGWGIIDLGDPAGLHAWREWESILFWNAAYESEAAMWAAAREKGWGDPELLLPAREQYEAFWK